LLKSIPDLTRSATKGYSMMSPGPGLPCPTCNGTGTI
jgi:hypothetical protein